MVTATDWVETEDVCAAMKIDVSTLYRIRKRSALREGFHFVRKNPSSKRGPLLFHLPRLLKALGWKL